MRKLLLLSFFSKGIFQSVLFVAVLLFSISVQAQIASAPTNTKSPWVNGTYTNLAASSTNNSSIFPPRVVSVSNTANVVDASTSNFATVSITGIGGIATVSVTDNDAADTYPAGTYAGFRVGTSSLLSASLASTVTIKTSNNGTVVETFAAIASLLDVGTLLLNSDGTATIGFVTKQPFDQITIEYGALVGALFSADVYHAVIEKFVAGTALACNIQTVSSNPTYPTYIQSVGTGITGLACVACSVTNAENVVSASTSDFATISMAVSAGATGALAVRDAITTYPAGTFTGFNILNPGLINANLLSGISIETYATSALGVRTLKETSSSGTLLSVGTFLSGGGAQTVGFVTTQPFDEVRIVSSNLLGVLSTTNVYNAVFQKFCAGPAVTSCSVNTNLVNPAYPVIIDGTKSGIGGVACLACSVNNSQNVIDSDLSNSASIVLAAGLLANGSIAVKDQISTYPAGTFAGFDIENSSLIGVNLFGGVTVKTYLAGVLKETSAGSLISLELLSSSRQIVGFKTTQAFDEVQITVGNFASVNLGSTTVYGAILRASSAAGIVAPILSVTTKANVCPATTVDLSTITASNTPSGTTLTYHSGTPATTLNKLASITGLAAGTYYAAFFDGTACYSTATTAVTTTVSACAGTIAFGGTPPTQTATTSQAKTGNAATELVPSGGTAPYTYSSGNGDATCVAPSGATGIIVPVVTAAGAYTYTAPATPGTYYYCIKVCDTTLPTAICKVNTYTVTVSATGLCTAVGAAVPTLK